MRVVRTYSYSTPVGTFTIQEVLNPPATKRWYLPRHNSESLGRFTTVGDAVVAAVARGKQKGVIVSDIPTEWTLDDGRRF